MQRKLLFLNLIVCFFLLVCHANAGMLIGSGAVSSCTAASSNGDITLFWRAQAADFSGTDGTLDFSDGDNVASLAGTAAINTDAALGANGTNGLDVPAYGDSATLTGTSIFDGAEIRVGFLLYINTMPSNWIKVFNANVDAQNRIVIQVDDSTGIQLFWEDSDVARCTTDAIYSSLTTGVTYWVEGWGSAANDDCGLYIYNYSTGALLGSDTDTTGTISDIGAPDIVWGNLDDRSADYYLDLLIISLDPTTSLLDYRDDTAYNSCN